MSEFESLVTEFLQEISKSSTQCESIHFIGEDGVIVAIPLFICGLIWPSLVHAVREIYCPCEEVTYYAVSVPCDSRILTSIKDLVFTGRYSSPDYDMVKRVCEFTLNGYLKLDIKIHEMYQRDVSLSLYTLEAYEHHKNIKYESQIESDLSFGKNIGYSQDTYDGDMNSIIYGISGNCEERHEKETLPNQEVFEVVSSKLKQQGNRCSKFCRNDCGRIFESWSAADAQQIKDLFRGRSYVEIKHKMNSHLKAQLIINHGNDEGYIFKGHIRVSQNCKKSEFFAAQLHIVVSVPKKSTHKISRVFMLFSGAATTFNFIKGSTKGKILKNVFWLFCPPCW